MAATYLDFTTDPTADFAVNPVVTAKNADGSTDTAYTGTVTLSLTTGTGTPTATLTGTVSLAAVAGVATWTNTQALAVTDNGTYTLTATSASLTAAESASFAYTLAVERNALSAIRSAARLRLGITPSATTEEDDPDLTLWPALITASRDDVVRKALNSTRLLSDEEVLVRVTGAREYDLSRAGFVRVDRLGYGAADSVTWLPLVQKADALPLQGEDLDATGEPAWFYSDGLSTIGCVPVPTDTTKYFHVHGLRVPDSLSADNDRSGLLPLFNECVALGAAWRLAQARPFRRDFAALWPVLQAEQERMLSDLRVLATRTLPNPGGHRVSYFAARCLRTMRGRTR